jgi:di/tricarboxylate transporter
LRDFAIPANPNRMIETVIPKFNLSAAQSVPMTRRALCVFTFLTTFFVSGRPDSDQSATAGAFIAIAVSLCPIFHLNPSHMI